jgi:hypothetical protein
LPVRLVAADNRQSTRVLADTCPCWSNLRENALEFVQFEIPGPSRRVGVIEGDVVRDLTSRDPAFSYLYDVVQAAFAAGLPFTEFVRSLVADDSIPTLSRQLLFQGAAGGNEPFVHPPVDHPDPHRILVSGTGLTHTGSMESRDQMHSAQKESGSDFQTQTPQTDSARMFESGLRGGKPQPGVRGIAPEWFYKGDGGMLRGHRATLEIPPFALDGGEEPEIVGCYIIDSRGQPRRIGFTLGNEWSDHETEAISYLHLAPSKLRTCAMGPTLLGDWDFEDISLGCEVKRQGRTIYDSGSLRSGERWMCHSLQNLEDHHFKYPQHRRPGDIHLHFFGTSQLSYKTRDWRFEAGDEIRIESPAFSGALVNFVAGRPQSDERPIAVIPA